MSKNWRRPQIGFGRHEPSETERLQRLGRLAILTASDPTAEPLAARLRAEALTLSDLFKRASDTDIESVSVRAEPYECSTG